MLEINVNDIVRTNRDNTLALVVAVLPETLHEPRRYLAYPLGQEFEWTLEYPDINKIVSRADWLAAHINRAALEGWGSPRSTEQSFEGICKHCHMAITEYPSGWVHDSSASDNPKNCHNLYDSEMDENSTQAEPI